MGLLTQGETLVWQDTKALADHVRKHGVIQFLNQYWKNRQLVKRDFLWGDEVENMIVKFDHENKTVKLSLKGGQLVDTLTKKRLEHGDRGSLWTTEFAAYMIESTPSEPFDFNATLSGSVESNMRNRRNQLQECLHPDETPITISVFPRLGCPGFTSPPHVPDPAVIPWSLFFPEEAVCQDHPRWRNLSQNPVLRRGSKMHINIPIFKDINTPDPFIDDLASYGDDGTSQPGSLPDHIYMDAVGFAFGNCCLQVTVQASTLDEARLLYDQLLPMCSIMIALSAGSPVYKGYLSDLDHRWSVNCQAVDDRSDREREPKSPSTRPVIGRPRYTHSHHYISTQGDRFNDIDLDYNTEVLSYLLNEGVDRQMSRHVAHLFVRDTISVFKEKIHLDDTSSVDHFENINSTNWQSLRLKIPVPDWDIGWRVEFRPMDIQTTDFENAAYSTFIILLTRVILTFRLNLMIPVSKIDENMTKAVRRDALLEEKFHFRKDIFEESPDNAHVKDESECRHMTINEIINGNGSDFPGLIPLMWRYIDLFDCDFENSCTMYGYLNLISKRASGDIKTTARSIRHFFTSHPLYRRDSVVTERMNYDLFTKLNQGHVL